MATLTPLAMGWESFHAILMGARNYDDGIPVNIVRLAFYFGARVALNAVNRGEMGCVLMAAELRDFDREHTARQEDDTCQPASIS